ncbi:hypothetical protein [Pareuzebyella sediminis]|uniref:hypothetical protein n=1 Tax=Pareuzebyella sediminis TaxID=2607998 RepID=UPI0011EE9DE1|nr:hypothetical protein [Pareuzebyella sediminis]
MKDALSWFFAELYEVWLGVYDTKFVLIYQTLYEEGGYLWFGLIFILIPLLLLILFYFLWKYPYGRFWHWLLWWLIISLVVAFVIWRVSEVAIFDSNNQSLTDALADLETGYDRHARTLPLQYAIYSSLISLGLGFIYSLVLKRWSKIQIHLPF